MPVVVNDTGADDSRGLTSPTRTRAKQAACGGGQCGEGAKLPPLHPSLYFLIGAEEDRSGGEEAASSPTPPPPFGLRVSKSDCRQCRKQIVVEQFFEPFVVNPSDFLPTEHTEYTEEHAINHRAPPHSVFCTCRSFFRVFRVFRGQHGVDPVTPAAPAAFSCFSSFSWLTHPDPVPVKAAQSPHLRQFGFQSG